MKVPLLGFMLIIFGIFTAVFIANLSKIISLESGNTSSFNDVNKSSLSNKVLADTADHLHWFIQISDLHISVFHDRLRIEELKQFCDITVGIINPLLVLATGDLTDAKESDNVGSRQLVDEWKLYRGVLDGCKHLKRIKWLDVRGNHDNFDVPGARSSRNYFRNFSMVGESNSYSHTVKTSGGTVVRFIAVDACPDQGIRRPFNFVGLLGKNDLAELQAMARALPTPDHIIWFGHYPTSCILAQANGLRRVMGGEGASLAYLCGHLHTLGGLLPNMYTRHQQGFLELELADWKDNRMFRVVGLDNGLISFTDCKHGDWPIILVTNPKVPMFAHHREPVHSIASSTHIRILVFSVGELVSVEIELGGSGWLPCRHVSGPLYVLEWNPAHFSQGTHTLKVRASDNLANSKSISHDFSLGGEEYKYSLLARICLMTNIGSVSQLFFGLVIVSCTVPLCVLRHLNKQNQGQRILPEIESKLLRTWIKKLSLLANIDQIFYRIIIYPLYLSFGPWCIGEVINGHIGFVFAWGTIINGTYLPGAFTYTHGFFQLVTFQWPFMLVLSHLLDSRVCREGKGSFCGSLGMGCVLALQLYQCFYFWRAYGSLALVLGPFRTWPIFIIVHSWYQVNNLSSSAVRNSAAYWAS